MKKLKIVMVGIGTGGIAIADTIQNDSNLNKDIQTVAVDLNSESLDNTKADKKIELALEPVIGLGYNKAAIIKYLHNKTKKEIQEIREELQHK